MNITRLIKVGMNGEDVRFIQNKLNQLKFYTGPSNGVFDRVLLLAIQKYQSVKGLEPDGKVGMITWNKLSADNASAPSVTLPEKEVIRVADIIKPEVKSEPTGVINLDKIKQTVIKLGYIFDNDFNIVVMRTNIDIPDVFNDYLFCIYNDNGEMKMNTYVVTSNPGVYWLNNPMNVKGTAMIKPGQYKDSHSIGLHQGKADHKALVQRGTLTVYRDNDKDNYAEETNVTETGANFGVNIHGSNKNSKSKVISKWSAGCIVFDDWTKKEEFIDLCEKHKGDNKFTLTLIKESDL